MSPKQTSGKRILDGRVASLYDLNDTDTTLQKNTKTANKSTTNTTNAVFQSPQSVFSSCKRRKVKRKDGVTPLLAVGTIFGLKSTSAATKPTSFGSKRPYIKKVAPSPACCSSNATSLPFSAHLPEISLEQKHMGKTKNLSTLFFRRMKTCT